MHLFAQQAPSVYSGLATLDDMETDMVPPPPPAATYDMYQQGFTSDQMEGLFADRREEQLLLLGLIL